MASPKLAPARSKPSKDSVLQFVQYGGEELILQEALTLWNKLVFHSQVY